LSYSQRIITGRSQDGKKTLFWVSSNASGRR
jgi:hypothetical protein